MSELKLFEFECLDCKETILLEKNKNPLICPYCEGDINYSVGKVEPVIEYMPRKHQKED